MSARAVSADDILDDLAERIAARLEARQRRHQQPGWVPQTGSLLGPRRHCAAVKRRLLKEEGGARLDGRTHYLSAEAYQEELGRIHKRSVERTPVHVGPGVVKASARSEFLAQLRTIDGGNSPRGRR